MGHIARWEGFYPDWCCAIGVFINASSNGIYNVYNLQTVGEKFDLFEIFSNTHKPETGSGRGPMTSSSGRGLYVL